MSQGDMLGWYVWGDMFGVIFSRKLGWYVWSRLISGNGIILFSICYRLLHQHKNQTSTPVR
jgi:hypothetical protein